MSEAPAVREYEADLVVTAVDQQADGVIALTLAHPGGDPLPPWTPGAHIDLLLGPDLVRQYSLCGSPADTTSYRVGVLRAPDSRGGSVFIHDALPVGATVTVRGPRNNFPLVASPRYLFIAGGIGVTPMLPMIEDAAAAGADWQLVYGGRTDASMAFTGELLGYGERVSLLPDDTAEVSLPTRLPDLLGTPRPDTLVYCCGPEALLAAVEAACAPWPSGSLHVEWFAAKAQDPDAENHAFDVELARSGITVHVPADTSVFRACEDAGVSVLGSCHEGICGTCETVVLDGDVDHRDSVLNDEEKASNETMMVCVSRAKSATLTIDL